LAVTKSAVKLEELYVLNAYQVISAKLKPTKHINSRRIISYSMLSKASFYIVLLLRLDISEQGGYVDPPGGLTLDEQGGH